MLDSPTYHIFLRSGPGPTPVRTQGPVLLTSGPGPPKVGPVHTTSGPDTRTCGFGPVRFGSGKVQDRTLDSLMVTPLSKHTLWTTQPYTPISLHNRPWLLSHSYFISLRFFHLSYALYITLLASPFFSCRASSLVFHIWIFRCLSFFMVGEGVRMHLTLPTPRDTSLPYIYLAIVEYDFISLLRLIHTSYKFQ